MTDNQKKITSLRERKKARTRRELAKLAQALFLKQGYEETTLEQIADQAEVSVRTVLRYFESKPRLALAGMRANLNQFRTRLQAPQRNQGTLSCWREHVQDSARSLTDVRSFARYRKMIDAVPVLVAGLLEISQGYENALEAALALDAGVDPETNLHGRLLAAMLVAGNSAVVRHWIEDGQRADLLTSCVAVVDFAIESFPAPTEVTHLARSISVK